MENYQKTSVTFLTASNLDKQSLLDFQGFFLEHLGGAGRLIFEGDNRFSFYTLYDAHDIEGLAIRFSREYSATLQFFADGDRNHWVTKRGQIENGNSNVELMY